MKKWEENEAKKEYLKGYLKAKAKETTKLEQIQQLRLDKMFPCIQGDGLPSGSSHSDLSDYAVKMEELIDELKKIRLEAVEQYTSIEKAIARVKDDDEQEVLTRHYLLDQSWENIAEKMKCTVRNVHYIHGRALKNFSYHFIVFHKDK